MTMDREKEREIELESAMYTNCLLLGLDPAIIGIGANNGTPRVGLFRHSNPKLGEQLLYFILSSLRGPIQSAKVRTLLATFFFLRFFSLTQLLFISLSPILQDFDKVWPIFDSAQSRDFRKVTFLSLFVFSKFPAGLSWTFSLQIYDYRLFLTFKSIRLCKESLVSWNHKGRFLGATQGFLLLQLVADLGLFLEARLFFQYLSIFPGN